MVSDPDNPRDYMDYLIIAGLSFDAISQAFLQLYLAFIDTNVSTLRVAPSLIRKTFWAYLKE